MTVYEYREETAYGSGGKVNIPDDAREVEVHYNSDRSMAKVQYLAPADDADE